MVEKVKNLFSKYGILAYTGLIVLLSIIIIIICSIVSMGKFDLKKVENKVDNIIEKSKDKISDIKIKEVSNDIEKKVALEKEEEKREEITKKIQDITIISSKKKRIEELIKLNKSIEVKL